MKVTFFCGTGQYDNSKYIALPVQKTNDQDDSRSTTQKFEWLTDKNPNAPIDR
jgi:hypothetical protein